MHDSISRLLLTVVSSKLNNPDLGVFKIDDNYNFSLTFRFLFACPFAHFRPFSRPIATNWQPAVVFFETFIIDSQSHGLDLDSFFLPSTTQSTSNRPLGKLQTLHRHMISFAIMLSLFQHHYFNLKGRQLLYSTSVLIIQLFGRHLLIADIPSFSLFYFHTQGYASTYLAYLSSSFLLYTKLLYIAKGLRISKSTKNQIVFYIIILLSKCNFIFFCTHNFFLGVSIVIYFHFM